MSITLFRVGTHGERKDAHMPYPKHAFLLVEMYVILVFEFFKSTLCEIVMR